MRLRIRAFKKISWKLTMIYALIFSVVLVLLNAGTLFGLRGFLIEQAKSQVEDETGSAMRAVLSQIGRQSGGSALLVGVQPADEMTVRLTDMQGGQLATTDRYGRDLPDAASDPGVTTVAEAKGTHLVIRDEPVRPNGKTVAYLQVAYDMRKEYYFIKALFALMAAADAMGIVASVFAGIIISRRMLRPIDRITGAAKRISIHDLNRRIDVGEADDELTRLAVTFNEMIGRLQAAFEQQNRFVSDASHELRTPISIIRGYTDVVDRWGRDDPAVLEESIRAVQKETDNMSVLVERLLFLAKGESGRIRLQTESFDAGALAAEVAGESRLLISDRTIECGAEPVKLTADRKLVKQMLRALVDNSIKFTPPGGTIEITAARQGSGVRFTVADTGIGIPPEEIGRIFDRFYVVDKARSKEKGGSGLGLAIVKWIAEAHGGSISAKSPDTGGTVFTAVFPQSPAPEDLSS